MVARAAERAGEFDAALRLYAEAYSLAPEAAREGYAETLSRYGRPLPRPRSRARPPVGTYGLTAALLVAFLLQLALDREVGNVVVGGRLMQPSTAAAAFLMNFGDVPASDAWWRYLSYALVHAGLIHIGFNAWVLFDIGRLFEARRRWGDLVASFVAGTVAGAALTVVVQAGVELALVGASGGVLGVAGALLVDAAGGTSGGDRALTRSLLQWMAILVIFSLAIPNVSLWGHVGGVLGGAAWGLIRRNLPDLPRLGMVVGGLGLVLMAASLVQVGAFVMRHLL